MNNLAQKPDGIFSYFCQDCVTGSDLDHRRLVDRSQNLIRARAREREKERERNSPLVKSPPTVPIRSLELCVTHVSFYENEFGWLSRHRGWSMILVQPCRCITLVCFAHCVTIHLGMSVCWNFWALIKEVVLGEF